MANPTHADRDNLNTLWRRLMFNAGFVHPTDFPFAFIAEGDATTENLTLYVEQNGDDSNAGTDPTRPCATPQGALLKLAGKRPRHQVKIKIGPGSFPGFNIQGFWMDPIDESTGTGLGISVLGSYTPATLASGTTSGVLTGSSTGNALLPLYTVITDSTQNWPINGLKRLLVQIGTSMAAVTSNTATTITLAMNAAFGSIGSAYTILTHATRITTPARVPNGLAVAHGTPSASKTHGIGIWNNMVGPSQWIRLEGLWIDCPADIGVYSISNIGTVRMDRCRISGTVPVAGLWVGGSFVGRTNVIDLNNISASSIYSDVPTQLDFTQSIMTNAAGLTNASAMQMQGPGHSVNLASTYIDMHAYGIKILLTYGSIFQLAGNYISTNGMSQAILCSCAQHAGYGSTTIVVNGLEARDCSTALQMEGPHVAYLDGTQIYNCTYGVIVGLGARVRFAADSNINGGTTQILLDGTARTVSNLRAANPKLLSSAYFSLVYE